jgi:hypothetical protein
MQVGGVVVVKEDQVMLYDEVEVEGLAYSVILR